MAGNNAFSLCCQTSDYRVDVSTEPPPGPEDIKNDIGQNHLRDCGIENDMRNVAPIHYLPFRELRK